MADSAPRHVRTDGCLDEQAPGVSGLTHMSNVGGEGRQWAGYTDRKSNRFLYFFFFTIRSEDHKYKGVTPSVFTPAEDFVIPSMLTDLLLHPPVPLQILTLAYPCLSQQKRPQGQRCQTHPFPPSLCLEKE